MSIFINIHHQAQIKLYKKYNIIEHYTSTSGTTYKYTSTTALGGWEGFSTPPHPIFVSQQCQKDKYFKYTNLMNLTNHHFLFGDAMPVKAQIYVTVL